MTSVCLSACWLFACLRVCVSTCLFFCYKLRSLATSMTARLLVCFLRYAIVCMSGSLLCEVCTADSPLLQTYRRQTAGKKICFSLPARPRSAVRLSASLLPVSLLFCCLIVCFSTASCLHICRSLFLCSFVCLSAVCMSACSMSVILLPGGELPRHIKGMLVGKLKLTPKGNQGGCD